jgi:hypothetical protein
VPLITNHKYSKQFRFFINTVGAILCTVYILDPCTEKSVFAEMAADYNSKAASISHRFRKLTKFFLIIAGDSL